MTKPPAGQATQSPEGRRSRSSRGAHRAPVTVTLRFLPGAEPWVMVTHEDRQWRQPAQLAVWELVLQLLGWS